MDRQNRVAPPPLSKLAHVCHNMVRNNQNVNETYVLVFACVAVCKPKQ